MSSSGAPGVDTIAHSQEHGEPSGPPNIRARLSRAHGMGGAVRRASGRRDSSPGRANRASIHPYTTATVEPHGWSRARSRGGRGVATVLTSSKELYAAPAASRRRARASAFVGALPAGTEVLIVSATRGAADDVARDLAWREAATFGLHRFSLPQLAARLAATRLAAAGLAPATSLAAQAIAARAVFDARTAGALEYFAPVAWMPGFAPALARSLHDLRMADAEARTIERAGEGGRDLASLYDAAVAQFETGGAADRSQLCTVAREVLESGASFCEGRAVVLVDVAIDTAVERAFVTALLARASGWLACVPADDRSALKALEGLAGVVDVDRDASDGELDRLRRHLFKPGEPPLSARGSDVVFFSAPGEGREAVEVARYLLDEARRGVRFDEMAVLLRSPREYLGLLEHAFTRAGISASFGRGTRRPHPAGRALLALLTCADENLSANRFAEYLSLAQVPAAAIDDAGPGFSRADAVSTREGAGPTARAPKGAPGPGPRSVEPVVSQPSLFDDPV